MNQSISKLFKIFSFGTALFIMLAAFQVSSPTSVSALVCNPNQWYADQCARCDAVGGRMGDFGSDYGPNPGSAEWCSCAARKGDTGSLMNHSCPQAPRSNTNPGQVARSCDELGGDFGYCPGLRTYDQCTLSYRGNEAWYNCTASQNPNCTTPDGVRCPAKDKVAPAQGGTGGASAVVECPANTTPGQNSQGVTVCVANANNNQNNNSNISGSSSYAYAQGGAGGSVTINAPVQQSGRVVTAGTQVKQLPKTGFPAALALAGLAFLPFGFGLRGYGRGIKPSRQGSADYLWEKRKFQVQH